MDTTSATPPQAFDEYDTEPLPLPRRRRLPILTAVLVVGAVAAGGFVGGIQVQKHYGGTSSGAANGAAAAFASRFGATGTGATSTTTTPTGSSARGGFGGFGAGGGATVGTVTAIKGSTLYVTDSSGNTVKVTTSPASAVTKSVDSNVQGINPGDTVVVRGTAAKNGTVAAQSITVGGADSTGSGLVGAGASGLGSGGTSGSGGATGFGGGSGGATGFGGGGG